MSKKYASNDKDRLLVENFKKFMEEGDFSPALNENDSSSELIQALSNFEQKLNIIIAAEKRMPDLWNYKPHLGEAEILLADVNKALDLLESPPQSKDSSEEISEGDHRDTHRALTEGKGAYLEDYFYAPHEDEDGEYRDHRGAWKDDSLEGVRKDHDWVRKIEKERKGLKAQDLGAIAKAIARRPDIPEEVVKFLARFWKTFGNADALRNIKGASGAVDFLGKYSREYNWLNNDSSIKGYDISGIIHHSIAGPTSRYMEMLMKWIKRRQSYVHCVINPKSCPSSGGSASTGGMDDSPYGHRGMGEQILKRSK